MLLSFAQSHAGRVNLFRETLRKLDLNLFLHSPIGALSQRNENPWVALLQRTQHGFIDRIGIVLKDRLRYFRGEITLRTASWVAAYTLGSRLQILDTSGHCSSTVLSGSYHCISLESTGEPEAA